MNEWFSDDDDTVRKLILLRNPRSSFAGGPWFPRIDSTRSRPILPIFVYCDGRLRDPAGAGLAREGFDIGISLNFVADTPFSIGVGGPEYSGGAVTRSLGRYTPIRSHEGPAFEGKAALDYRRTVPFELSGLLIAERTLLPRRCLL